MRRMTGQPEGAAIVTVGASIVASALGSVVGTAHAIGWPLSQANLGGAVGYGAGFGLVVGLIVAPLAANFPASSRPRMVLAAASVCGAVAGGLMWLWNSWLAAC